MWQASYGGKICSHCRETYHADHECALASVKDQGSDRGPSPPPLKKGRPFRPKTSQRPETLENICISWNRGNCIFTPNCKMQHICASCKKAEHRVKDCSVTADDTPYKQPFRQAGRIRASKAPRPMTAMQRLHRCLPGLDLVLGLGIQLVLDLLV